MVHRYDRDIRFGGWSAGEAAVGSIQGQTFGVAGVHGTYSCTNFTIKRDICTAETLADLRDVVNTLILDLTKPRS